MLPSVLRIAAALGHLLTEAAFWANVATTAMEIALAVLIGGALGVAVGVLVGGARLIRRAYEPALHYLAPTPKIVFLPIAIALCGVGPPSKVAMGALSCFFPVALSVASGMALVSQVHLRVARSFGFSRLRTFRSVYFPSLIPPLLTGLRLGFGVAVIGCLLSEIKLSNRGLGFMAIQYYNQFRIPEMYAVLVAIFVLAWLGNALLDRIPARGATRLV